MTPSDEPAPPGARELLLRTALGTLLGLLPACVFIALLPSGRREWYYFVAIGLFLGGITGLAGFVERLGATRGAAAQVGLALALWPLTAAWGLASVFQAEWTKAALSAGPGVADDRLLQLLSRLKLDRIVALFAPLGAVVAALALVRMRRGRWLAQAAAGALPVVVGAYLAPRMGRDPEFVLVFGAGLLGLDASSRWAAGKLARRWWPDAEPPTTEGPG